MIVCIAEKPSVARDIADVLGARNRKDGYIEGNGYQVTWTFGHLCALKEPHEYTSAWKVWTLGSLPMIPPRFGIKLISDSGIEKQFHIIEKLMQHADEIINCGDAGQEGELIQRWVMQKAGVHCPVKRLWISSLTEEAIREGFEQLKDQLKAYEGKEITYKSTINDMTSQLKEKEQELESSKELQNRNNDLLLQIEQMRVENREALEALKQESSVKLFEVVQELKDQIKEKDMIMYNLF